MKIYKYIVLAFVFLVAGTFFSCKGSGKTKAEQSQLEQAFRFTVSGINGDAVTLDQYQGKVLLIDFWDTWCPPCKAEIPHFVELYSTYQNQGLEILGVAFGREGMQVLNDFIAEYSINYPTALANEEILAGFGGINSIPTTFLIDREGKIYKKYVGYQGKSVFENDIKALL